MEFFLFLNSIASLFLNMSFVTVLTFEHPIDIHSYGSHQTDIYSKVSTDGKTLILKPLTKNIDTNMVVITSGGTYNFLLKVENSKAKSHKFVAVKNGKHDSFFTKVKETRGYEIFEGEYSIRIKNKLATKLNINDKIIGSKELAHIPKGPPVFINGERVLY